MGSQKAKDFRSIPPKTPFVTPIIVKICKRLSATILLEPEFNFVGHITFKNGKTSFFRNTNLNINSLGSIEIAKDKGYAAFFLKQFGFQVPEGQTFFSEKLCKHVSNPRNIDDGHAYARKLDFPVILKPNSKSQGTLVTKVYNKKEFYRVAKAIFKIDSVMLVQRYYQGNDFRIIVLDKEVISAYQRFPLAVIGDGSSTIKQLLQRRGSEFQNIDRDTVLDFDDFRIPMKLKRQGFDLSSIVSDDQKIQLLDNANLSTGGDVKDITDKIHSDWSNLAIDVTSRMGLRFCGVDILTSDITTSLTEDYIIIEINGAPGLDNYASIGKEQTKRVESLYEKVLLALEKQ